MLASGLKSKPKEVKTAILLNVIGEDGVELFNTFYLEEEDKSDYDKVLYEFEKYASPRKKVVVERFLFNTRKQQEGEPFDFFVTDLKKLVKTCEYGDQTDSVLRDRIVLGISDLAVQERLLRITEVSLD